MTCFRPKFGSTSWLLGRNCEHPSLAPRGRMIWIIVSNYSSTDVASPDPPLVGLGRVGCVACRARARPAREWERARARGVAPAARTALPLGSSSQRGPPGTEARVPSCLPHSLLQATRASYTPERTARFLSLLSRFFLSLCLLPLSGFSLPLASSSLWLLPLTGLFLFMASSSAWLPLCTLASSRFFSGFLSRVPSGFRRADPDRSRVRPTYWTGGRMDWVAEARVGDLVAAPSIDRRPPLPRQVG